MLLSRCERKERAMNHLGLLGFGAVAIAAAACTSTTESTGSATVTSTTIVMGSEDAIARISLERCRRELSCDNVGKDRLWADMDSCRGTVTRETRAYFDSQGCNQGIDVFGLAVCVDRIRNASCTDEGSAVPRVPECRTSRLCR
jgi:hypothetical protein